MNTLFLQSLSFSRYRTCAALLALMFWFRLECLLYFLLGRFPCRSGVCRTPIEVMSCQLIAYEVVPTFVVKTLLYPGAIAKSIFKKKPIPTYNNILDVYKLKHFKHTPARIDIRHLEVSIFFIVTSTSFHT